VPIFAAGQEGDLLYFSMPYIPGVSLGQVIHTARRTESRTPGHMSSTFEDLVAQARSGSERTGPTAPTTEVPPPAKDPSSVLELRPDYIRSTVQLMAAVAEALHHAHEARIIHRDLKPSNLMVESNGHPWVLDFGLARVRPEPDGPSPAQPSPLPNRVAVTVGTVGTPPYMAPEHHEPGRDIDARTDVWGLGVTLYELVTLRQAFKGRESVLGSDPVPPTTLVKNLPRDLEAVILKALKKDPAKRYPTTLALSEDLKRWLRREPVSVWPVHRVARPPWRVWLWSKRNKGWAAAVGISLIALTSVLATALAGERAQRRESLLQQIQRIRLTPHRNGWFDAAWDLVRQAASIRRDRNLQAQAAICLLGLDARLVKQIERPANAPRFQANALAFDPAGQRLLIAAEGEGVTVWDRRTEEVRVLRPKDSAWIFAFRADGTALELVGEPDNEGLVGNLDLREVDSGRVVRRFDVSGGQKARVPAFTLTPNGSHLAVVTIAPKSQSLRLRVWQVESGRLGHEIAVDAQRPTTAVALSPDGRLVALGDADGHVTVWRLPEGEPIATFSAGRVQINVLRFGPDPVVRTHDDHDDPSDRWVLAAGDAGGSVTVWDLHRRNVRCLGRGTEVSTLAFSPDGTTLISGSATVRLWDIASGRLLLEVGQRNRTTALAISPDGKNLTVASVNIFGYPGGIDVWELDDHPGLRSLRGLQGPVTKLVLSSDGRRIAALEHGWQLGIWERDTGRLRWIFETPRGLFADNAGLAFSPENRQVVFATNGEAALWDLDTGRRLRKWDLPPALVDELAFLDPDHLMLLRIETEDGKRVPDSNAHPTAHPRVARLRNLLGPEPLRPIAEIRDYNWYVQQGVVAPDGSAFILSGFSGRSGNLVRSTSAYASASGKKLWTIPSEVPPSAWMVGFQFDPTGRFLSLNNDRRDVSQLLAMPDRTYLGIQLPGSHILGPAARRWLMRSDSSAGVGGSWYLWERGRKEPLLELEMREAGPARFDRDGRLAVFGQTDGTVTICDLAEVQKRLAEVGLGW
jgi:WD40 repeat protein